MKKIALVLFCLSLSLSLFASEIYKSNELGQMLSSVSTIGQEGYYLEVSDNLQTLYHNGKVFLTISTLQEGFQKTVTKTYTSGKVEKYEYENQLLKAETVISQDSTSKVTYNYIDNKLAFCIVNDSEIFFLRSTEDGALIAIKRGSEIELLSDSYLYQDGSIYNMATKNLVFTGSYETLDDGSFNFVDGEKTYHYSASGLLLSISGQDETQEYTYQDSKLISIKTTNSDSSYKIEFYQDGSRIKIEEYSKDGIITSTDDYTSGKLVRTVYKDGRAVADIYYKQDNVTVENIKYR
jgi:hypothetical protein